MSRPSSAVVKTTESEARAVAEDFTAKYSRPGKPAVSPKVFAAEQGGETVYIVALGLNQACIAAAAHFGLRVRNLDTKGRAGRKSAEEIIIETAARSPEKLKQLQDVLNRVMT